MILPFLLFYTFSFIAQIQGICCMQTMSTKMRDLALFQSKALIYRIANR